MPLQILENLSFGQRITPQNTALSVAAFLVPINTVMHLSALNLLGLNNSILFTQ